MSTNSSPRRDQLPARAGRPGALLALATATLLLGACGGLTQEPSGPSDTAPAEVATSEAPLWLPICQDGICNGGETHDTCPEDCEPGVIGPLYCGTGTCSIDENCSNCPWDCGSCDDRSGGGKKNP